MSLHIRIVGSQKLAAKLKKAGELGRRAQGAAAYNVGLAVLRKAVRYAPKDLGVLRGSGYVSKPDPAGNCTVGFGGPAKAYAWVQHERLDFHHRVGQAKYLERARNEVAPQAANLYVRILRRALASGSVPPTGGAPDNPNMGPTRSQAKAARHPKKAAAKTKKAARAGAKKAGAKKGKKKRT